MKKLIPPDNTNCTSHISTAFTYANNSPKYNITRDEVDTISKIYEKYDDLKGREDDEFKSILLSNYLNSALENSYNEIQEKGRLSSLREEILLSVNRCPFCGITAAEELDHHLPKSIYKSLGIYNRNLIPSCHICNNKKRTLVGIPHIYFDDFLEEHFLIAEVKMESGALSVQFKVDPQNLSPEEFEMIDKVIKRIDLNNRLQEECNIYLSSFSITMEMSFDSFKKEGVRQFLISQYEQNLRQFGQNDWRTAVILALSNCEGFYNEGFKDYYQSIIPS